MTWNSEAARDSVGRLSSTIGIDQRASTEYRADIDGLRAIAVVAILAFHLRLIETPGGYIGVDVFFVISGYLVGGGVLKDVRIHDYSVGRFYLRRVRRIIPALVIMLMTTTAFMWFIAFPNALLDYAKSLYLTIAFCSNFYFSMQVGYFDPTVELQPLVHTWSLAVEEQYYLLFPVLIWFLQNATRLKCDAPSVLSPYFRW